MVTWSHPDANIIVTPVGGDQRRVQVQMHDPEVFVAQRECVTSYPLSLIELLLEINGPRGLCYDILREESPTDVRLELELALLSFVPREAFQGARVLDFGCGTGGSTVILAHMLPDVREVVGVELDAPRIEAGAKRAAYYGLPNVRFEASPAPDRLTDGLGRFNFVVLSAVMEHLLPDERRILIPQLWDRLEEGGVLFVDEAPHRWFPVEFHTTGLPLLNYLPAVLASRAAVRLSNRSIGAAPTRAETWQGLLRGGIRGTTQHELVRIIRQAGGNPEPLTPLGCSHVDLWYEGSMRRRPRRIKRVIRWTYAAVSRLTGQPFMPCLIMAVRKH